jgi:hypothetical protein
VAAPPGQATRGTCRLGQCRHHLAAVAKPGTWPCRHAATPPLATWTCRHPHWRQALATWTCRHPHWRQALATWTCRHPHWRQAPQRLVASTSDVATATCRNWERRQALAGIGPGGTCHVSPGQGCRHSEGVFFGKYFQRWSLLPFYWCRWSLLSKIRDSSCLLLMCICVLFLLRPTCVFHRFFHDFLLRWIADGLKEHLIVHVYCHNPGILVISTPHKENKGRSIVQLDSRAMRPLLIINL